MTKRWQRGAGLVSMMLALSLSLGIVLSALHLTAQAELLHQRARQWALLEDQASQILELIERLVQQAGYVDVVRPMAPLPARPLQGAIDGADNATLVGNVPGGVLTAKAVSLASDLLLVRLRGDPAGTVVNCAGFAIPAATGADDLRGRVVLYIGLDPINEPELRCHYYGGSQWTSQAIASGVLSLQLRFGIDTDNDGLPNEFINATQLADRATQQSGTELSVRTRVVALYVALLMRSTQRLAIRLPNRSFNLFGPNSASCTAESDPDAQIKPHQLKPYRLHRQFDKVIFLNNSLRPEA